MDYHATSMLRPRPKPAQLTAAMAGIGMAFATEPDREANLEDTLIYASEVGMDEGDLRVLSVLTMWLGVHHAHVNADKLARVVSAHESARVRAYWDAIAHWLKRDRRLARLATGCEVGAVDLLPVGTDFQLQRRGEDARFAGSALRVPAGTLRERDSDVLSPQALAQVHRGYRDRVAGRAGL